MFSACRPWRTYTKARRSLSSLANATQHTPSRLVRLQGLPTGYDKDDILKGIGGLVEQVTFHENEADIQFFSQIHRLAFRKRWEGASLVDIKTDNISAGLVARIGHWGANRRMQFYLVSDLNTPDIIIDEVEAKVRSFGPLLPDRHGVQVDRFTTAKGVPGFNVTFMRLADALRCDELYRPLPQISSRFDWISSDLDLQHETRTVYISNLSRELVASRVLFEGLERSENSMITQITPSPATGTVTVTFSSPDKANDFLDTFPAILLGARAKLVPRRPLTMAQKIAIQSGAGRHVALFIDHISPVELGRDFAWYGDHEVHVYSDRAVLEFFDIKDALKAVTYMSAGTHRLPKKYTGALVSFAAKNSIQETKPVPIAEARYYYSNKED
ncbi:hypothetical protein BDZ89DRAFT_1070093 [Hymenopellis radicata]|nr:hypothetical protein BDZ89DRAFT_1070093 [Hymenopellis radicata]